MPVTEEDGGRLNAFAKEPKIELIQKGTSRSSASWIILISGALLIAVLIGVTVTIS